MLHGSIRNVLNTTTVERYTNVPDTNVPDTNVPDTSTLHERSRHEHVSNTRARTCLYVFVYRLQHTAQDNPNVEMSQLIKGAMKIPSSAPVLEECCSTAEGGAECWRTGGYEPYEEVGCVSSRQ